jgi:hypothetical protein
MMNNTFEKLLEYLNKIARDYLNWEIVARNPNFTLDLFDEYRKYLDKYDKHDFDQAFSSNINLTEQYFNKHIDYDWDMDGVIKNIRFNAIPNKLLENIDYSDDDELKQYILYARKHCNEKDIYPTDTTLECFNKIPDSIGWHFIDKNNTQNSNIAMDSNTTIDTIMQRGNIMLYNPSLVFNIQLKKDYRKNKEQYDKKYLDVMMYQDLIKSLTISFDDYRNEYNKECENGHWFIERDNPLLSFDLAKKVAFRSYDTLLHINSNGRSSAMDIAEDEENEIRINQLMQNEFEMANDNRNLINHEIYVDIYECWLEVPEELIENEITCYC